jgi:hypothetical protein
MSADQLFKVWVRVSAALLAAFIVWNFVPILIPLVVVGGALAIFTILVRKLAEYVRDRRGDHPIE